MKILQLIAIIIFNVSNLLSQSKSLKPSDYDKIHPQYFFAIEDAVDGDFEKSLLVFEKMLVQFPGHQEAFLLHEICTDALQNKISINAAEFFFEGINARNNSANPDQVLFYLNQAFKEEDSYLPFYLLRGIYFADINKYEWALSDLSAAIQLAPKLAMCYYNRGKLYFTNNFNMQALSDFNKTIEINPNYSSAYIRRAFIYENMNEINRALQDFKNAYSIDSTSIRSLENSSLLNNIATVYMEKNNFSTALEALNLSIQADNRWYEPFLNRGIVNKSLNKFEQAILDLNIAIELKPRLGKAYYNRGLIYKDKKDFGKAKEDLIQSLAFEDTEVNVFFTLAEVYKELKDHNKATEYYKKAIRSEPQNIWTYYQLASLYDKRRGFKEAVKYYDEFITRASNEYFEHKIKAKDRSDRIKKYLKQQKQLKKDKTKN
jgi:tetratricopeptide (TPR) repeat protein